jgi:hypothetical protein
MKPTQLLIITASSTSQRGDLGIQVSLLKIDHIPHKIRWTV